MLTVRHKVLEARSVLANEEKRPDYLRDFPMIKHRRRNYRIAGNVERLPGGWIQSWENIFRPEGSQTLEAEMLRKHPEDWTVIKHDWNLV